MLWETYIYISRLSINIEYNWNIVACSGCATNNCGFWITRIDLLDHTEVETTHSYHYSTADTGPSELPLNCSGLTPRRLFSLCHLSLVPLDGLRLFTQSPEAGSQRIWERSPPFMVLSICLQSGCLGNSRFPAATAETPTEVGFWGNALSEA
jgi:hypothetical protein